MVDDHPLLNGWRVQSLSRSACWLVGRLGRMRGRTSPACRAIDHEKWSSECERRGGCWRCWVVCSDIHTVQYILHSTVPYIVVPLLCVLYCTYSISLIGRCSWRDATRAHMCFRVGSDRLSDERGGKRKQKMRIPSSFDNERFIDSISASSRVGENTGLLYCTVPRSSSESMSAISYNSYSTVRRYCR